MIDQTFSDVEASDGVYLEALLHMFHEPVAILNADACVTSVNAGLEELFERHQSQILGRHFPEFFEKQAEVLQETLRQEVAWEGSLLLPLANLGRRDLIFRVQPVFSRSGSLLGWVVVVVPDGEKTFGTSESAVRLDPLTNLPNRQFLSARLSGILQEKKRQSSDQVIVMCVDLDGFDRVNKEFGRSVGDQILIETARRLGRSMRASNIIGRLVEDAFCVILPDARTDEQVTAVANRLTERISRPFIVKGVRDPIMLTGSVGIAVAPEHGDTATTLISHALSAADLAKQTGSGTYQFFSEETTVTAKERRSQVSKLRRAIEEDQLELVFQPKMSLHSNEIVSAEALVRWRDPVSGLVMPTDFIPLAEDAGLIDPLGNKVLREACAVLKKWHESGFPNLRIAVNVSAMEVARNSFYGDLRRIIEETGIEPDALELEITETSVMEGAEDIIRSLRDIRSLGVHLTADDFGTGYASLSYLRNFPLDGIKIDTTFVADIEQTEDNGGLASAVIAVGQSLGMKVVAEGVETDRQLKFLRWRQCDEAQGYLISEPLGAEDFLCFLQQSQVF